MVESDIMHESGGYWVGRDRAGKAYVVYKTGATHSTSESAYSLTRDGLSIAKARCDYLAKRDALHQPAEKPPSALERLCAGAGDVLPC